MQTKTKNLFLSALIGIFMVFGLAFGTMANNQNQTKQVYADPLPALQNVQINTTTGDLSWDAFAGAESYYFLLANGGGNLQGATTVNLENAAKRYHLETGSYNWTVYALDAQGNAISLKSTSDSSKGTNTEYDYQVSYQQYSFTNTQTALDKPANLTWNHTVASWDAVTNADSYTVTVYKAASNSIMSGASATRIIGTSHDFGAIFDVDTEYYFKVRADAGFEDLEHKNSDVAQSVIIQFDHVVESLTNVTINDQGELNFDNVTGAARYDINISNVGGTRTEKPINLYRFCEGELATGDYDVKINVYNEFKEPLAPQYIYQGFHWDTSYGRPSITGIPVINGTIKIGQTLTVDTSGLTYTGTLHYTWFSKNQFDDWVVVSAVDLTENTFVINGSLGFELKVRVDSTGNLGYVESAATTPVEPSDDQLTGTVEFSGDIEFDSDITATLTGSNNTFSSYLNYQWRRNGANIDGATTQIYRPVAADIGAVLSVVITSDVYQGSVTSGNTSAVAKGTVSAPTNLDATACTTYQNNNGTITGVTTAMEYKFSTAESWTVVTGDTVTGLVPGTYNVRYKETETTAASESTNVVVSPAPTKAISVTNGVAKIGNETVTAAATGATITIVADAPAAGMIFDRWTLGDDNITLANANSATTTFEMPNDYVFVTATYTFAQLTGTVTITGTLKYGAELSADVTETNNTGDFSYQWKRDGADIGGATNRYYHTMEADIGHALSVVVTSGHQSGSIASAQTSAIDKADGEAAPTDFVAYNCSNYLNNDGSINGILDTMEYKLSTDQNWTDGTGYSVTGLVPGTYNVRIKETSTQYASAIAEVVIASAPLNTITVNNGIAKIDENTVTQSAAGATITVIAYDPETGMMFDRWTQTGGVTFADSSSATTTFTMVSNNVTVVATYTGAPLTGTVTITGEKKFGATLTGHIEGTNNTGTLSYEWKRGSSTIAGATGTTYTLIASDIGQTITFEVSSDVQTGTLSETTAEIAKADGPAAPSTVGKTNCTDESNNDGTITGVTTDMEYKISTGDWADCEGTTITGLIPGTYNVRYKETETTLAGSIANVVIGEYNAPAVYAVTVNDGTASPTSATAGTQIEITADAAPAHKVFDTWTTLSAGVELASATSTTTTFTMPENDVTINATYKFITHTISFNKNLAAATGTKTAETVNEGSTYELPENPFTAEGYKFIGWATSASGAVLTSDIADVEADIELFAIWKIAISEIVVNSSVTSVKVGTLPHYTATTTTEHVSIQEYGSNTNWLKKPDGYINWSGFGSDTPTAVDDGTHYALRLACFTDDGYAFVSDATIMLNGFDVTHQGYTRINAGFDWGAYVIVDLGVAATPASLSATYDGTIYIGDTINPDNLSVTLTYTDNSTEDLNLLDDVVYYDGTTQILNPAAYVFDTAGQQIITLKYNFDQSITYNLTVNIHNGYSVTYRANGGTEVMMPEEHIHGEFRLPVNGFIAPTNMKFKCWSVGGVEKAVDDIIEVNANIFVDAVWEEKIIHEQVTAEQASAGANVSGFFEEAAFNNEKLEITVGTSKVTFSVDAVLAISAEVEVTFTMTTSDDVTDAGVDGAQKVINVSVNGFTAGTATVEVPFATAVPAGKIAKVYFVDNNGNKTDMNATFEGGKAIFVTTHFSKYVIAFEDSPVTPTGGGLGAGAIVGIIIAVIVVCGAGGFCLYWFVFRKKTIVVTPAQAPKAEPKAEQKEEVKTEKVEKTEKPEKKPESSVKKPAEKKPADKKPAAKKSTAKKTTSKAKK